MTTIPQSTNRLEIPARSTLRILKASCLNPQIVPVPGALAARIAQLSARISPAEYTQLQFCKHREIRDLEKYHKQSPGSLISNPADETNARLLDRVSLGALF